MRFPRQASARLLALFALASLAAFPLRGAYAKKSPPANGMIAYQSTEGGDGFTSEIYVMDADGKHPKRLTNSPASDDVAPVWSPLGDQIAFLTDRNGSGYEVYLMNADGSNQRPLRSAEEGGPALGGAVEWSPDGSKLKFINFGRVYVLSVVASALNEGGAVAAPADAFDSDASWSPDGTKLLVASSCTCGGAPDLYLVNADGSGRTRLTDTPGFEAVPRWSPAGGLIAYEADRGGDRGVYVANADGANEHLVSGAVGSLGAVAWSPDGGRIAFRSIDGGVYVVKADGSELTLVSSEPSSGGEIFWSPDGSRVGFNDSTGGFYDTFVVNSDGSSRKPDNYTKTKRADEFACSWQKLPTQ